MTGHIPPLPFGRALDWNGLHDGQAWTVPPGIAWQARLDQNGGAHVVCLNLESAGETFPDALDGDRPWRDSFDDALADARALEAAHMWTVRALHTTTNSTLTDLVDALDAALDQAPLLDGVERVLRDLRAALPRYEVAWRLAEAEANNLDGWERYTDDEAGRELRARNHAGLFDAIAAYRKAR